MSGICCGGGYPNGTSELTVCEGCPDMKLIKVDHQLPDDFNKLYFDAEGNSGTLDEVQS